MFDKVRHYHSKCSIHLVTGKYFNNKHVGKSDTQSYKRALQIFHDIIPHHLHIKAFLFHQ